MSIYDDLMTPVAPAESQSSDTFFGEVTTVDAYEVAWDETSRRFVVFDKGIHAPEQKRIEILINVTCERKDGSTYQIEQKTLNQGSYKSDKWRVTRESLSALGITPRDLLGKFAQVKRANTGKFWKAKKDGDRYKIGDDVPETAFQFVAVYDTKEQMDAAAAVFYKRDQANQSTAPTAQGTQQPTAAPVNAGERDFALKALGHLWTASNGDVKSFETMLTSNPMISKHFNMQSPEVQELITEDIPY